MATLELKHIDKIYDNNVQAVFDFNLEIKDREFIVFVGPSGCGKSTTLRMIAGLEEISRGELYINGKLVNEVDPKDRNIAMVFQSYALYPHMTVYDNMAFGLKLRKIDKDEIDDRVRKAAKMLQLTEYLDRKPKALSGGQRQRVALGRAIVRQADIFLMDEPLSNLDAKLRVQMRSEITQLHKRLDTTTIYVTHDQTEAMSMATRIVVMKDGRIQQVGTPEEIYYKPANVFVAGFVGSPQMNFLNGKVESDVIKIDRFEIPIKSEHKDYLKEYVGKEIYVGIRSEDFHLSPMEDSNGYIETKVEQTEMLGNETIVHTISNGNKILAKASGKIRDIEDGSDINLYVDLSDLHLFDKETEIRIF